MPNVRVTFDRIDVDKDGDPAVTDGKGDFFWRFNVNGNAVTQRSEGNPHQSGNGSTINLGASKSLELKDREDLIVDGFLGENDKGFAGKDEKADFQHTYDRSERWGNGPHQVALHDRKMRATLHYSISAG